MGRPCSATNELLQTRICTLCKQTKPLVEFVKNKGLKLNRSYYCYKCHSESIRWRFIFKRFGVTKAAYLKLYTKQQGVCAICKKKETAKRSKKHFMNTNKLAVDHNHKTGKVRGLLCSKCNMAIGIFQEDLIILKNAVNYLEEHCAFS